MFNANVYDQYRRTKVETMTPGKLLLMLYDGILLNLTKARESITANDVSRAHVHIIKAQNIIIELMCTLNMDYKISESLYSLYEYMHQRLVEGNIRKDEEPLAEVEAMISDLRQTWDEAIKSLGRKQVNKANSYQALNVSS